MASHQQEYVKHVEELFLDAYDEYKAGRFAAAEEKFGRLVPLQQRVEGGEHEATLSSRTLHASSLMHLGRYSEAEPIYRDVLQIKQQSPEFGMEHHSTLDSVTQLGECLTTQGRYKEAEPMLRKVHAIHVRVLGPLDSFTLKMQVILGECLANDNQLEEAEGLLRDAYEGFKNQKDSVYITGAMASLGRCLSKGGKAMEAESICRQSVKHCRHTLGEQHLLTLRSMEQHADVLRALGRNAEAEVMYKLALQARGTDDNTLNIADKLGYCMWAQGKVQQTEALLLDTLERVQQELGENHPSAIHCMKQLVQLFLSTNKSPEAKALRRRAKELARANQQ